MLNFTDAKTLLKQKFYKYGKWRFDVAEYYSEIGICNPDSQCVFKNEIASANGKFSILIIKSVMRSIIY